MSSIKERTINWPEGAQTIDIQFPVTHGGVRGVDVPPELRLRKEIRPTRIRFVSDSPRPSQVIPISIYYDGDSQLPTDLPIVVDPALSLDNAIASEVDDYRECRLRGCETGGFLGMARRFFFGIDDRTLPDLCKRRGEQHDCDIFYRSQLNLRTRLNSRKTGSPMTQELDEGIIPIVTSVFRDAFDESGLSSFDEEMRAYLHFAAGLLQHDCIRKGDIAAGPNGGNLFLFAEFAFFAAEYSKCQETIQFWTKRLPTLVLMQKVLRHRMNGRQVLSLIGHKLERIVEEEELNELKSRFLIDCEENPARMSKLFLEETVRSVVEMIGDYA